MNFTYLESLSKEELINLILEKENKIDLPMQLNTLSTTIHYKDLQITVSIDLDNNYKPYSKSRLYKSGCVEIKTLSYSKTPDILWDNLSYFESNRNNMSVMIKECSEDLSTLAKEEDYPTILSYVSQLVDELLKQK